MALTSEQAARVKPLHDYVLLETEQNEESPGGIYLPLSARDPITEGKVLAVGPGRWNDLIHERVPLQVREGMRVRIRAWSAAEVDGRNNRARFMLVREDDVMAVIE